MPRVHGVYIFVVLTFGVLVGCAQATTAVAARMSPPWEPAVATPLQVPLRVQNPLGVGRRSEPVTSGIPLARESGITSIEQLQLTDSQGRPVPAQFRVLSRWGQLEDPKARIKWVLVDFQSTVPAGASVSYSLRQGTPAPEKTPMEVSETGSTVQISTGPLIARISRQGGGLLDQLWLISKEIDGPPSSARLALLSDSVSLRVEKPGGPFRSVIAKDGVKIEERGPLRTVVRVQGTFRNAQGVQWFGGDARPAMQDGRPAAEEQPLEFIARLTFFADKAYFKLTVTLQNNGNSLSTYYPVNDAFFDGLYVEIPWQMEEPRRVAFPEHDEVRAPGARWILTQSHEIRDPLDEGRNFIRRLTRDGELVTSSRRADGWATVCNKAHCDWVGVRAFWQNYPKSLEMSASRAAIGLWPAGATKQETGEYGRGNYFFSGSWHKTHDIFLSFFPKVEKEPLPNNILLEAPLFAVAPPAWHAETRAWSLIGPAGFKAADAATQEAIGRYDRFRAIMIDSDASDDEVTLKHLEETRGLGTATAPGVHFDIDLYGWEAFGELPWGGNLAGFYSALHYDWSFIMWLHFIRSGDLRYWPVALAMTDHSSDLDQIHSRGSGTNADGIWWWEQLIDGKRHHRSTQGAGLIISYTWNGGYALGYLLTGDPRYRDAAEAGARAGRRFWFEQMYKVSQTPVVFDQTRSQGWSILMLINLYRIDGKIDHLQDALTIFKNSLLYTEQRPTVPGSGGKGFISHYDPADKVYHGTVVITFLTYPLEPLSELHYEASLAGLDVKELEAYLIRSLDWLKNFAYVGGVADKGGGYSPLTLSYATDPNNRSKNQGGETAHNMHVAGGFAYGYLMLKDKDPQKAKEYFDFARALFRDLMFYRQIRDLTRDKFIDANLRSPVSLGWPGTATKELGWIGRSGQFYLHAEYLLSKRQVNP